MFVVYLTILFLSIHYGQCSIAATATLHLDGTTTSIGTLTLYQENASSPVTITGTLTSLNASSSLVRKIKQRKKKDNLVLF